MRMGFGLIALLLALAVAAVLAKKQLGATRVAAPPVLQPAADPASAATVRAQGQQLQQQVREQVEALMRQPRPNPDDSQ